MQVRCRDKSSKENTDSRTVLFVIISINTGSPSHGNVIRRFFGGSDRDFQALQVKGLTYTNMESWLMVGVCLSSLTIAPRNMNIY